MIHFWSLRVPYWLVFDFQQANSVHISSKNEFICSISWPRWIPNTTAVLFIFPATTLFRLMQSNIKWLLFIQCGIVQPITFAVLGYNISFHSNCKCFHLSALLTRTIGNIEKIVNKLNRAKQKSINMSYALAKRRWWNRGKWRKFFFDLDFLFRC